MTINNSTADSSETAYLTAPDDTPIRLADLSVIRNAVRYLGPGYRLDEVTRECGRILAFVSYASSGLDPHEEYVYHYRGITDLGRVLFSEVDDYDDDEPCARAA